VSNSSVSPKKEVIGKKEGEQTSFFERDRVAISFSLGTSLLSFLDKQRSAMPIDTSIVRIRTLDRNVVGAGFLVDYQHIFTCAHVVTQALGLAEEAPFGRNIGPFNRV